VSRIKVKDFGENGLRIAYREGTVDERTIKPWMEWMRHFASSPLRPGADATILDVGAHIGAFTLAAAGFVPKGRVLAVEACRESYEMLVRNIELNALTNVEAAHLALSDRSGETLLHHSEAGNWGHTITKPLPGGGEKVPAETLAGYLREKNVRRCDVAKFNCEGAEFPILMSTPAETLRIVRQMVIFYHADLVGGPYHPDGLERHLKTAGFELERNESTQSRGSIFARLAPRAEARRAR
jgi:FkbM family methyltransferase